MQNSIRNISKSNPPIHKKDNNHNQYSLHQKCMVSLTLEDKVMEFHINRRKEKHSMIMSIGAKKKILDKIQHSFIVKLLSQLES